MRYADYAYAHACNRPNDPQRGEVLDNKAQSEGYANTSDYVDNVQGRGDTRSFGSSDGRTCWSNKEAGLYGWNNSSEPENSTVVPSRNADRDFERQKGVEADRQGVEKEAIQESGPISEADRQVPDRGTVKDDGSQSQGGAPSPSSQSTPQSESSSGQEAAPETQGQQTQVSYPPPPPPPPPPKSQDAAQSQGHSR